MYTQVQNKKTNVFMSKIDVWDYQHVLLHMSLHLIIYGIWAIMFIQNLSPCCIMLLYSGSQVIISLLYGIVPTCEEHIHFTKEGNYILIVIVTAPVLYCYWLIVHL